jgi:hypothetical protein
VELTRRPSTSTARGEDGEEPDDEEKAFAALVDTVYKVGRAPPRLPISAPPPNSCEEMRETPSKRKRGFGV